MSFKLSRFFSFFSSLIVGTFFVLTGICTIAIPFSEKMRNGLVNLLNNSSFIFVLFGVGLFIVGVSIIIYSFFWMKRRYDHVRIRGGSVSIDENLVQQYLQNYWQELFRMNIPTAVTIKRDSIRIVVDLPYLPEGEQRGFLERVQQDFADIFERKLGIYKQIDLLASFGNQKS